MSSQDAQVEKIKSNWTKVENLVSKIQNPSKRKAVESLLGEVVNRFMLAPANYKNEYAGAFPGGLIHLNLKVMKLTNDFIKVYDPNFSDIDSIIICGLFHSLGKIGSEDEDYFLDQESTWHREKGMMYKYNPKLSSVHYSYRSLWWLNKHKVELTLDELYAIGSTSQMTNAVQVDEFYDAPILAVALQNAIRVVSIQNKNKATILD